MAKKFTVNELRGIALYLQVRGEGMKKRKRELLLGYAKDVNAAADFIEKMENQPKRKSK